MGPNTWANIIAAIGAIATLVTALSLLVPTLRTVKDVHKIVNSQRTDMLNFQRALIRSLVEAGVAVPVDQSLPDDPEEVLARHAAPRVRTRDPGGPLTPAELRDTAEDQAERFPSEDE